MQLKPSAKVEILPANENIYEKAIEETRGKNPKIVTISSEDVRNAAERMKHEKYQYERPNRTGNRFHTDNNNERKKFS